MDYEGDLIGISHHRLVEPDYQDSIRQALDVDSRCPLRGTIVSSHPHHTCISSRPSLPAELSRVWRTEARSAIDFWNHFGPVSTGPRFKHCRCSTPGQNLLVPNHSPCPTPPAFSTPKYSSTSWVRLADILARLEGILTHPIQQGQSPQKRLSLSSTSVSPTALDSSALPTCWTTGTPSGLTCTSVLGCSLCVPEPDVPEALPAPAPRVSLMKDFAIDTPPHKAVLDVSQIDDALFAIVISAGSWVWATRQHFEQKCVEEVDAP